MFKVEGRQEPQIERLRALINGQPALQQMGDLVLALEEVQEWLPSRDGFTAFARVYHAVLVQFRDWGLAGRWCDPAWALALNVKVFRRFVLALIDPEGRPACWQTFAKQRSRRRVGWVRFACAAGLPHIQYDLTMSLFELWYAQKAWPTSEQQEDFVAMSQLIGRAFSEVTMGRFAAVMRWADSKFMEGYRSLAWDNACRLLEIARTSGRNVEYAAKLDRRVARATKFFLWPA
jgi:hypothetical protein